MIEKTFFKTEKQGLVTNNTVPSSFENNVLAMSDS